MKHLLQAFNIEKSNKELPIGAGVKNSQNNYFHFFFTINWKKSLSQKIILTRIYGYFHLFLFHPFLNHLGDLIP